MSILRGISIFIDVYLQFTFTNRALLGDGLNVLTQNYFAWLSAIEGKVWIMAQAHEFLLILRCSWFNTSSTTLPFVTT